MPPPHQIRGLIPSSRGWICLALAALTIFMGLALRLIPSSLPVFVVKYGGSALWAAMVYLLLVVLLSSRKPATIATLAGGIAALVELSRLLHTPAFDAFRMTLAGKLLLGRVFNPWHFLVYWITIAAIAVIDQISARNKKAGAEAACRHSKSEKY